MKILLIGGTGILSTEICNLSIKKGIDVILLNRGKRKSFTDGKVRTIIGDVRLENIDELRSKISGIHFDVVVDFVSYTVSELAKMIKVFQGNCNQFIFISTATAYKYSSKLPYLESSEIGNNTWNYAMEKSKCEWYLEEVKNELDFSYTIIRPYVTYGKTRIPYQIIPQEYYTLINRVILNKPIPICGLNTICTLTNTYDFAVGTIGLFMNESAFGQAVHITADSCQTWYEVIQFIGQRLKREVVIIDIPIARLKKGKFLLGFDTEELLGDKIHNRIFDNSKIKQLVPEFTGDIGYKEGISRSIDFFEQNAEYCIINYKWDARIDNLLAKCIKKTVSRQKLNNLNLGAYGGTCTRKNKIIYIINRYNFFYYPIKIVSKLFKKVKKVWG